MPLAPYTFAGFCGETFTDKYGNAYAGLRVRVTVNGVDASTEVYVGRDGTIPAQNPITADRNGRISFYAKPGTYQLVPILRGVNGSPVTVIVAADPEDAVALGGGVGGPGGVTVHGNLLGLEADDHSQYALADGTRGAFEVTGAAVTVVTAHDVTTVAHADAAFTGLMVWNGTTYVRAPGRRIWLWGAGEPSPAASMAENDIVIGNGG